MKITRKFLLAVLMIFTSAAFARNGGDDVGNGGFAYKQSVIILKMATSDLEHKIKFSTLQDLVDHPERRTILMDTLGYNDLDKFSKKNRSRNGELLQMDYVVSPPAVVILKPYFVAFSGRTDDAHEREVASLYVQKLLLHEAAHIWGYKEDAAEEFAKEFLMNVSNESTRATNDIMIKPDFCSCLSGKSDIGPQCDKFCESEVNSEQPLLYVNTIIGPQTAANSKLGNLYNWCTVQLHNDTTTPQCSLNATDGKNTYNIPVTINYGSNSFSANIISLAKNRDWTLKLVENKTGSFAQTTQFTIKRISQPFPGEELGALQISQNTQYSCLQYSYERNQTTGTISRNGPVKQYFFYSGIRTPSPIPLELPPSVFCHDEIKYPGNDSVEYERLEEIKSFSSWDDSDPRFGLTNMRLNINQILEKQLIEQYNIPADLDLFQMINTARRPNSSSMLPLTYIMIPFVYSNGKAFCPTSRDADNSNPLLSLLQKFTGETEGLYLADEEPQVLQNSSIYKIYHNVAFITESNLERYGFYILNGDKVKATREDFHSRRIFYYGPTDDTQDPLVKGARKIFTITSFDELSDHSFGTISSFNKTSDKRIGCIPKEEN
jgi:hypothetical protein